MHRFAQGTTAPTALKVADCRSAAMLIKSALRDWLYESYILIRITVISHLRWLSPLWCLTAPPSPRGIGRATKGKRLYGQARRLTSPDLHILCRMCTVDNKAPRGNLPICDSIVSTGYSAPACGGKVVAPATKGGHTGMVHEVYDALFFSPYPSFPLEGKSREAGKGVRGRAPIGCSIAVLTANRRPPERSDAQRTHFALCELDL